MKKEYYTLPLRFDQLLEKRQHTRCQLNDSIAQHLHIMLSSHFGESRFNPDYGCSLWEFDFKMVPDPKENKFKWKESVKLSYEETIRQSEPRLSNVRVRVEIEDFIEDYKVSRKVSKKIRKRLWVQVDATISITNQEFSFTEYLFIAPISPD